MDGFELRGTTAPCKDCPDRYLGCHSECERYADFCRELERIRAARKEGSELNAYQSEAYRRLLKRKRNYESY